MYTRSEKRHPTSLSRHSGGSVLFQLLTSKEKALADCTISALVRKEEQAKVLRVEGVEPILFKDLDDSEALTRAAADHDGVLSSA